ncbi:DegV family protein [Anaerosacchariphilus polymeriproducens]|uniref:DegV family protein n=1 Tax=Anaerosacchariphilus polymeriproducens TaxID=1812858 RepID=A0A371AR86_9FIRM|nr:DegV family protein [Anaerosacchariphilus polymeriproducens]RDU22052.1 DegV family protein [Anaerosacchariphilus polymeriproducens]
MSFKVVIDSCGELPKELKGDQRFETASLEIDVDDYHIVDDETFDQAAFLKMVKESPNVPKSSCPSPEKYMKAYHCDAEHVYAVTLSSKLSGSYNSAELGRQLYEEEYGSKDIYVFDSKSASVGETLIAMKVLEYEEAGMAFEEVIKNVETFINEMQTFFVLETLDTLRKNGRLSNLKAFLANTLNIKPVMGATPIGEICQLDQARGMKKALDKMIDQIVEKAVRPEEKILAISHCNCFERAKEFKEAVAKRCRFKDIFIVDTAGISSMYANDGGIIAVV